MFNLKQKKSHSVTDLLKSELSSFDIIINPTGIYELQIGEEHLNASTIQECIDYINEALTELKQRLWEEWHDLEHLSGVICQQDSMNNDGLENAYFLNSVKKSFVLSSLFSDLDDVSVSLHNVFNVDITKIPSELISKFNRMYLRIKLIHQLVMREIYRIQLLKRYKQLHKVAQISGPWANLDLPMAERKWEFDDTEEEYFSTSEKQLKEQVRYNPEYLGAGSSATQQGFFYVWEDKNRDPYKYEDMGKSDSPYKSRLLMTIP